MKYEVCPFCHEPHPVGPEQNDKAVECRCGFILQQAVPIFRQSDTGYVWRIIGATRPVPPVKRD